jgi:hypothetical protein
MLCSRGLSSILLAIALGGCVAGTKPVEQPPPVVSLPPQGGSAPFVLGERLTYDAYYGLIHAGTATLLVQDLVEVCGKPTYHIVLTAKTSPTFSKIFKVDDRIETFIDQQEFFPWKFAKLLYEGDYRCDEETILDQANHVGHYRSNRSGYTKDYEIPERCQDTLSVFYFLRLLDYSPGQEFLLKVMADEKIWDVAVSVKERVKRTIYRGASYDTFLLTPNIAFDSGSLRKGIARLWISTDPRKLIVCIKSKLAFGYLTFALVKVDNIYDQQQPQTSSIFPPLTPPQTEFFPIQGLPWTNKAPLSYDWARLLLAYTSTDT